jgi:hypothetical protein
LQIQTQQKELSEEVEEKGNSTLQFSATKTIPNPLSDINIRLGSIPDTLDLEISKQGVELANGPEQTY